MNESMRPSAEFGPVRVYLGSRGGRYPNGNQVIVQGSGSRAVFDSPLVSRCIGADFDQADLVIQGHIHEDHTAGLARLPRAPVYVHKLDLPALRTWGGCKSAYGYDEVTWQEQKQYMREKFDFVVRPDAIGYDDGAVWDLGGGVKVHAVHMPGHTAGHCILLVEPVGLAFLGDIELSSFGPYYGDKSSSLAETRQTLARLPGIPASIWVTSHSRGIYTDRNLMLKDLQAFTGRIDRREDAILKLLRAGPQTPDELVGHGVLWPEDFSAFWVQATERHTIARHLEELLARGLVAVDAHDRYVLNS